jgi:dihydroorotate dehydrogenase electron transfer subunit
LNYLIEKPQQVATDHILLRVSSDFTSSQPGQFVNIRPTAGSDPLIRRPFSIFNQHDSIIELVIKVIGRGTRLIAAFEPGPLDMLGPLGKGFTIINGKHALLVGGGVGNAPLYYLARMLREAGNRVTFVYGTRSEEYIYLEDRFAETTENFIIATDDGSRGRKGLVTTFAEEILRGPQTVDMVYTCGPAPMMASLSSICNSMGVPVEVSLENYFGCGIGLCSGCTVATTAGQKRSCVEGPVMDGSIILWDSISD